MPFSPSEADLLNLSGKNWEPIPRISRTIPFGYKIAENNPNVLEPVLFELEALEQGKRHVKNGYSYRNVANWLSEITGRDISHAGLRKRIEIDRRRSKQVSTLKKWATAYKEALNKAEEYEKKIGKRAIDSPSTIEEIGRVPDGLG